LLLQVQGADEISYFLISLRIQTSFKVVRNRIVSLETVESKKGVDKF
jgi:hypothetical protein